jgi:hypothetical protein
MTGMTEGDDDELNARDAEEVAQKQYERGGKKVVPQVPLGLRAVEDALDREVGALKPLS